MAKVNLRAYNRDIEAMIDRGQLDEAIAHCQHILKTFPKHLETYRLLGKVYLEYKRYPDAVDIFQRVLASEPNDFVSNVGMSIIRDEENKLDDAIWHMERAFEVQPSNPAIQGELQRLYARRDGVQPPRIRMTRGALAHMYVQGELFPQAISEIKSVLKEDQGRSDMQVLLARTYYRSGQKNDAADTAMSVLQRYPYCLDANRVLTEILSIDRPEKANTYRQRVYELDPYATQVSGSLFQSGEVNDNAITLDRLEWNGQPVRQTSDWGSTRAIAPETNFGRTVQQPAADWGSTATSFNAPPAQPTAASSAPAAASSFDFTAPSSPAPSTVPTDDNIPDFLRAAGWGESTGAFDESKATLADEPAPASDASIEQADLPDWVKAMMPQNAAASQPAQPSAPSAAPAEEEELPDWIKNIGAGSVAAAAATAAAQPDWLTPNEAEAPVAQPATDQPDWMNDLATPASTDTPDWLKGLDTSVTAPADGQSDWLSAPAADSTGPDWLKGLEEEPSAVADQPDWMRGMEQPAAEPALGDQPDWLKGLDESPAAETAAPGWMQGLDSAPAAAEADWLKNMDASAQPAAPITNETTDFMKDLGQAEAAPTPVTDLPDWLMEDEQPVTSVAETNAPDWLGESEKTEPPVSSIEQPDWLTQFGHPEQPAPVVETPAASVADLGTSQSEIDDSLAWLEGLAAKQGATEGLLVKPEDRKAEEPDWVKKIKGEQLAPVAEAPAPTPVAETPIASVADLGTSQSEIDDSLAWLEGLAAKQGATEGLLVKPEDRKAEEPDWVKKIKGEQPAPVVETPAPTPVAETPASPVADLGTSQSEIDDSLAWLEGLAAKQGATEGLLVKPEDRKAEEPDWVKKIKGEQPAPVVETPAPTPVAETPASSVADLGTSQSEIDDSLAWLEGLAAKQGATEGLLIKPEDRKAEEPDWVKQVKSAPVAETPTPVVETPAASVADLGTSQSEIDDSLAWLEGLAAKQGATEGLLIKPEDRKAEEPDWVKQVKSAPQEPAPAPASDTAEWLRSLDAEEEREPESAASDAPIPWLQALDVEPVAPANAAADDLPAWLQGLEAEEQAPETVAAVPAEEAVSADWLDAIEEHVPAPTQESASSEEVPSWLKGLDEEPDVTITAAADDLPAWLRDETGEVVAEPTKIQPTRASDWHPAPQAKPEPAPEPEPAPQPKPQPVASVPVEETPKPKPAARKPKPAAEPKPEPYREPVTTVRGTGMLSMPADPTLGAARTELSRSNIPGALESYGKLIKKGKFLDEVIFDLREALYRYPVEVSIWQSLGDAYMRANRLQDALDAYTKAEELLR